MDIDRPATNAWPPLRYADWSATCDTLHAHTQVLGKLAAALGPPEPQLQHAALRLTARGWETAPLPAADGAGTVTVALDLDFDKAVTRSEVLVLIPESMEKALTGASEPY